LNSKELDCEIDEANVYAGLTGGTGATGFTGDTGTVFGCHLCFLDSISKDAFA
jgi:hypothetical protein